MVVVFPFHHVTPSAPISPIRCLPASPFEQLVHPFERQKASPKIQTH